MIPASKIPFRGVVFSLAAALLWGLVPIYIAVVDAAVPYEIVAYRALWSGIMLFVFVLLTGGIQMVPVVIANKKTRRGLAISSLLLTANWGLFVFAVQGGHTIEAALGYFIYPIVAVVLGILLLREYLDRLGWMAAAIVLCGVLCKIGLDGQLPLIGLCLAITFGLYGVIRKKIGIDPVIGMFVETIVVMPLAASYLAWMAYDGQTIFYGGGIVNVLLAIVAGAITVVPLILYHAGNRDLPIAATSLLFYVNPTTQLCLGIFFFGEAFTLGDGLTFGFIWAGIVVYFVSRPNIHQTSATKK